MLLKPYFSVGPCLLLGLALVSPAWAEVVSVHSQATLSISADGEQKISPPLQAFIQEVWRTSPTVQGAQAELEAAQAHADAADKPLHNPALELDTERAAADTTTIGLSQTLDLSNKRGARTRIAEREAEAAEATLREVRQQITVEILDTLARYFTTREMQVLALRSSELMKGFLDTVKQRQAAGDVGALDVTLAQVVYSEALMAQAASESEQVEAEAALQAVSGLTLAQWPTLPDELALPSRQAAPALLDTLPQLVVLRHRTAAAKARINLAKRQGRIDPTIAIRAGSEDSDSLQGLTIDFPLFVRNNFKAEVRAASYEANAEEQLYRDAYQRANARLSGALGRFANTSRAWRGWVDTGQQAHREQMELLELMWQAGELSATDFLIQAKQNIDTQSAATTLMGEVWRSAIAWLDASGQAEQWLGLADHDTETNSGESK